MKFQLTPFDAMWAKPFTSACAAILTTLIIAVPLGSSGRAEDPAYFMTIYGTEPTGPMNPPANAHTWAVFVAAADGDLNSPDLETTVISWDAADGRVFLFEGLERGWLYDLDETMSLVQAHHAKATRLPVVQIRRKLYDAAVAQYKALNEGIRSNRAFYTVMDNLKARINLLKGRHGFTNCIHAVADTGARAGLTYLQTHGLRGISASRAVNNYLSAFVIARNPEWDSIYDSRFP